MKNTVAKSKKVHKAIAKHKNSKNNKVIYVFQGGGALGSFQVGGVEALVENSFVADMVVGISIGGFNAAIVAGNPPEKRVEKLKEFWNTITTHIPFPNIPFHGMSKIHNFMGSQAALMFGQKGFYKPKTKNPWLIQNGTPEEFCFYDTEPMRQTLQKVVDFDYINQKHVRLILGATQLDTGEFVFFDSGKETITIEHILASGALPPGFPASKIDDKYYVDGGVYANTPLSMVLDEFASNENDVGHVLCFMFDLFSASGVLPHSMDGMLERIKDIQYSSHSKRSNARYATTQNLSHAIRFIGDKLTDEQRNDPEIKELLRLGNANSLDLVHVIYRSLKGTELHSKDYNFSAESAEIHYTQGYQQTKQLIIAEQESWKHKINNGSVIYTVNHGAVVEEEM
jgi:NTE family protein